jgi:glycosyltransferase involved in cell wall biosynthesis
MPSAARPRRVLYVQHAPLGGSALSLLYTVTALDPARWKPVVAFAKPAASILALFKDAGIECLAWPGIRTFEHSTLDYMRWWSPRDWARGMALAAGLSGTVGRVRELVEQVKPDLIHLNAVVLLPAAIALKDRPEPWVWHVREPPVEGAFGLRTGAVGRALRNWPSEALFISEADRRAWMGSDGGVVVHNYVDLERFHPRVAGARAELAIGPDAPVVAYVGGVSAVKGIEPLLAALAIVRERIPGLRCIMPGTDYEPSRSFAARAARGVLPLLGSGTLSQRVSRRIRDSGLEKVCIRLPYTPDIVPILAAADVVVFPALRAHFPRPAVEAAALGKPVVASRLPGIDEVVEDGQTGLLTPAGDPRALAAALERVLSDRTIAQNLGRQARRRAEARFDRTRQVKRITDIYEAVLGDGR